MEELKESIGLSLSDPRSWAKPKSRKLCGQLKPSEEDFRVMTYWTYLYECPLYFKDNPSALVCACLWRSPRDETETPKIVAVFNFKKYHNGMGKESS